jgi:hypothetical protein
MYENYNKLWPTTKHLQLKYVVLFHVCHRQTCTSNLWNLGHTSWKKSTLILETRVKSYVLDVHNVLNCHVCVIGRNHCWRTRWTSLLLDQNSIVEKSINSLIWMSKQSWEAKKVGHRVWREWAIEVYVERKGTNKKCDDIDDHFKHGHCLCDAQNKYALVNPI